MAQYFPTYLVKEEEKEEKKEKNKKEKINNKN